MKHIIFQSQGQRPAQTSLWTGGNSFVVNVEGLAGGGKVWTFIIWYSDPCNARDHI